MRIYASHRHGIEVPEENRDYYRDYAVSHEGLPSNPPKLKVTLTMEKPMDVRLPSDYLSDSDYDYSDYGSNFECLCETCCDYDEYFDPYY